MTDNHKLVKQKEINKILQKILQYLSDCKLQNNGLFTGHIGVSLFFILYSYHYEETSYKYKGIAIIDKVFKDIENSEQPVTNFCSGLAGIGWFLEYLNQNPFLLGELNTNEILKDVDSLINFNLKKSLYQNNWDFLYGGVGLGLYFLKRIKHCPSSLNQIEIILAFFENTAQEHITGGFKWKVNSNYQNDEMQYNIGLAHGMVGIILFLLKINEMKLFKERTKNLIYRGIQYIMAQEINVKQYGSFFSYSASSFNSPSIKSRLGWCYGDLGISIMLWRAGVLLNNKLWKEKAMEILLHTALTRTDLGSNMVNDAGLCHGTAGIAHIFNRVWRNTGIFQFKQTSDYWFDQTIIMSKFDDGLAGYKTFHAKDGGIWVNEYGVLEGITGIGLSLLSYATETDPNWDEFLLLS